MKALALLLLAQLTDQVTVTQFDFAATPCDSTVQTCEEDALTQGSLIYNLNERSARTWSGFLVGVCRYMVRGDYEGAIEVDPALCDDVVPVGRRIVELTPESRSEYSCCASDVEPSTPFITEGESWPEGWPDDWGRNSVVCRNQCCGEKYAWAVERDEVWGLMAEEKDGWYIISWFTRWRKNSPAPETGEQGFWSRLLSTFY